MDYLGENLIFLISQPRAGSTLLQRILAGHPEIHTQSEPWLMLHPLYGLKNGAGYRAEYDAEIARTAVKDFLALLPSGENEFLGGIRTMYGRLYGKALEVSGKSFFLDKTPRYYFIVRELRDTFPRAHFIILLRNPVAVLCSMVRTWVKGKWRLLRQYKHDLTRAPAILLDALQNPAPNVLPVRYEQLVQDAPGVLRKICAWLGIEFVPGIIDYAAFDMPRWPLGDQGSVYEHGRPSSGGLEDWVRALEDPQTWRLARDYLEFLGSENLSRMGYNYDELKATLGARRPARTRLWRTSSMTRLLGSGE